MIGLLQHSLFRPAPKRGGTGKAGVLVKSMLGRPTMQDAMLAYGRECDRTLNACSDDDQTREELEKIASTIGIQVDSGFVIGITAHFDQAGPDEADFATVRENVANHMLDKLLRRLGAE